MRSPNSPIRGFRSPVLAAGSALLFSAVHFACSSSPGPGASGSTAGDGGNTVAPDSGNPNRRESGSLVGGDSAPPPSADAGRAVTPDASSSDATGPVDHDAGGSGDGGSGHEHGSDSGHGHDSGSPASYSPVGVPGSWTLTFDDEFDGTTLDTSRWSYGWFTGANQEENPGPLSGPVNPAEDDCYSPSQVSVSGGYLALSIVKEASPVSCTSGSNKSFETGMITTQNWNGSSPYFGYTYGAAEARIWLPTPTNRGTSGPTTTTSGPVADWPAWWAPGTGEIDIMEGLGGTTCWHVHNSAYTLAGGSCPSAPSGATGWGGEWHTYASVWANGTVTFYYDGANAGTETSAELGATTPLGAQQKYLVLAMQTDGSTELTYPATMYVDYVRVWKQ